MADLTQNFPRLFNGGHNDTEGDDLEKQTENGLGASNAFTKYGLLNFVFAVIQKSGLNYTQVFELPVTDFLVIANYVADESDESKKEFKRQQQQFKNRTRR